MLDVGIQNRRVHGIIVSTMMMNAFLSLALVMLTKTQGTLV